MKPIVIILNGYPGSGKDEFCKIADKKYCCVNYSSIDTSKKVAEIMGWDGSKTLYFRAMLSAIKDFHIEWFDGPYKEMIEIIKAHIVYNINATYKTNFVFLHIREPKEIDKIAEWCSINCVKCYTVFINRKFVIGDQSNSADKNVENYIYDVYMNNNNTITEFEERINILLKSLKNNTFDINVV